MAQWIARRSSKPEEGNSSDGVGQPEVASSSLAESAPVIPFNLTQVEAGRFPELRETDIFGAGGAGNGASPTHRRALKTYIQRLLLEGEGPTDLTHQTKGLKFMAFTRDGGGQKRRRKTPKHHSSSAAAKHHNATAPQTQQPPCNRHVVTVVSNHHDTPTAMEL